MVATRSGETTVHSLAQTPAREPQQEIANRKRRTLDIELDDLTSVRGAAELCAVRLRAHAVSAFCSLTPKVTWALL